MAALLVLWALVCAPGRASAHPLGNFTINHFTEILAGSRLVHIRYIVDMAEIPSLQLLQDADANADAQVDDAEKRRLLDQEAERLAGGIRLEARGAPQTLTLANQTIAVTPGQGGLPTVRIELSFETPAPYLDSAQQLEYHDTNDTGRLGWHEIVVRNADGVRIDSASVPAHTISDELRAYPPERVNSPLDVRDAQFGAQLDAAAQSVKKAGTLVPASAPAVDQLQVLTSGDLTPPVIASALVLAFLLGAGHALTPGHGKTIVAAYLVGSRGTPRHAVILGLATTITHTAGIFALGLLTLFAATYVVPDQIFPWLELLSGLMVIGIGVLLLRQRGGYLIRRLRERVSHVAKRSAATLQHDHTHEHGPHTHTHDGNHILADWIADHREHRASAQQAVSLRSLIGLGISGGLLPCPSALVLLLGSVALGRVAFGLLLVVLFSIGLAAVLTLIGLLLVSTRTWFERFPTGGLVIRIIPLLSALLVTVIGIGLTYTALERLL